MNEEADGPVEVVRLPVAERRQAVARGEVAYTVVGGSRAGSREIIGAYDAVAGWAKRSGRELDGSPREIYRPIRQRGAEMEIAWPIR